MNVYGCIHSAPWLTCSTSPGSRSKAALSAIAFCRLSHYLPPCEVLAHLCTLVFKGEKNGKEEGTLLRLQRPFHVVMYTLHNVIASLSKRSTELKTYVD